MLINPNTTSRAGSQRPDIKYDEEAAIWDPSQSVLSEATALFQNREFAVLDDVPDLPATPVLRVLRKNPYASQSASRKAFYDLNKRALDITGSLLMLVFTLPLFAVVAILIKVTTPGPVFFKHRRLGRHGKEFCCLKFRTMVADAEEQLRRDAHLRQQFEEKFKIKHDPRITRVGKFLRKTSIDELPQLLQVLRGDMSLIGPRPIVKPELSKYAIYSNKLLSVKPGLSGLWQVTGRSDTTYAARVLMDIHYIDHRSLLLDIQLLISTAIIVLKKSGAC